MTGSEKRCRSSRTRRLTFLRPLSGRSGDSGGALKQPLGGSVAESAIFSVNVLTSSHRHAWEHSIHLSVILVSHQFGDESACHDRSDRPRHNDKILESYDEKDR